jgi:hypothetical protein
MRVEGRLLTTLSNRGTSTLSQAKSNYNYINICAGMEEEGMGQLSRQGQIYNASLL